MSRILLPIGIWLLALLAVGCRPAPLEQQGVPFSWGYRLDEPEATGMMARNLQGNDFLNSRSITVEIPLRHRLDSDSVLLPALPLLDLSELKSLPGEIELCIAWTHDRTEDVFPEFRLDNPQPWFAELERVADSLLSTFARPPRTFILGNDLRPSEIYPNHWRSAFISLRKRHPETRWGYGKMLDEIPSQTWWGACDLLAVEYPSEGDPNPRPFGIAHTPPVVRLADSLGLPVLIYRANVVGMQKTIQLRNRLRFWRPLKLSGIVLNSLYERIPLYDSTSYFALAKDAEALDFLHRYAHEGEPPPPNAVQSKK